MVGVGECWKGEGGRWGGSVMVLAEEEIYVGSAGS